MRPAAFFHSSDPARGEWSATHSAGRDAAIVADANSALSAIDELGESTGRWAGFFNYDLSRQFEQLPNKAVDDLGLPMLAMIRCDGRRTDPPRTVDVAPSTAVRSNFDRDAYQAAVEQCLALISAGDVFQINLSQRFELLLPADPWTIFARLVSRHPARYGAFLDFGRFQLLCNSPELFLHVTRQPDGSRRIITRPIKGTRPTGLAQFEQLLASGKDKAELAMIVDLMRNDLGRICKTGSVRVTEPRTIERHPTVLHGVATIEGALRDDVTLRDILRATFPCGSVTGCPKIRAMQIIEELEPVRRGAYCGAIGWIENGEMELAVAIRTMTAIEGKIYIPVGGGVVADSDPAAEYEETLVKARAMFEAVGIKLSTPSNEL